MNSILLVEDETVLADTLLRSIKKLGYRCEWARTLKEARSFLQNSERAQTSFDLMVLDRNLPDGDGIELLKHPLRKKILTLVLSSKSNLDERVKGLQAGADDYLPKPFSFSELAARLEALKRRIPEKKETEKRTKNESILWTNDPNRLAVCTPVGWIELTPLEFKLLTYLIERAGMIVSKDRLLRDVWGFSFLPKTRTVDYLITQLRKQIEPNPESPQHLLTIRGAGIKFLA